MIWIDFPTTSLATWNSTVEAGATAASAQVAYPDPTRNIASYAASIGLTATTAAFLTAARGQSKANWDDALAAPAVIKYLQDGFYFPAVTDATLQADGHSIILQPGLDVSRTIEVTFTRVVPGITKAAVEAIVNDVGAIVADLIVASEASGILTAIKLHGIAVDESTALPMIGATLRLPLDIGGR